MENLKRKKPKDLKAHERFVLGVIGEYGVKDNYVLKDLMEYNPDDFLTASNDVISSDGSDY